MSAVRAAENLLAVDQQEELENLPKDDLLSTSEEEGHSEGERKHQKLLGAIGSLDGKSGWKLPERSEAGLQVSEFSVSSAGSGGKLVLSDLLESARAPSSLASVRRQLSRVKSKKTVELPLSEEAAGRIRREAAFGKASQALSKWDPIVLKNRRARQLVFPLNQEPVAFAPLEHEFSGWKARTPLEQEIFNLLHRNKQPVADPLLTPVEKATLEAMSLEEAKMRRSELQRARALQSYYEARARRERKIKSKKYHRVLKKEKAKKSLKAFKALQKVDPTAALGVLEKIESTRVMERMSLRHQNRGKWARSKAIMAKYRLETRQAKQEQLARNKELMQKLQAASESEEEGVGGELLVPEAANEVQMDGHGPNPWMLRSLSDGAREEETQKSPGQLSETVAPKASGSEEEDESMTEEILLKELEERQSLRRLSGLGRDAQLVGSQEATGLSSWELLSKSKTLPQKLNKENHPSGKHQAGPAGAVLPVQREGPATEKAKALSQRPERTRTLEELNTKGCFQNKIQPRPVLEGQWWERSPRSHPGAPTERKVKEQVIDLQNLLTIEYSMKGLGGEEQSNQKQMIKEAFAGDDIIRDFLKEKREAVEASKPKDTELTLPGWGEWGGMRLKPRAKKRRRFSTRAPKGPPRKDKDLRNVIINENRNIQAAAHQVQVLPHPFTYCQQFERTIQAPIGCAWNTQRAFQMLTAPAVVTRPGHIITPVKAEDVGFRSSSVPASLSHRGVQATLPASQRQLQGNCRVAGGVTSCAGTRGPR